MSPTFTKDPSGLKLIIERSFTAPCARVWEAWTTSELLEKWWAPKPYKAITKSFEFKVGGHWHYYMHGPNGEQEWCLVEYDSITPLESFSGFDGFCDENRVIRTDMPGMHWHNQFVDEGAGTKVIVTITFKKEGELEKILELGMKEGFTMALQNLDEVLA